MFVNVGLDIPEGFGYAIRINEDVTSGGGMLEKFQLHMSLYSYYHQ